MVQLNQRQIDQLIRLVKDPADKKLIRTFLREIKKTGTGKKGLARKSIMKKKSAKDALNILWRIGTEFGKHWLLDSFFDQFD
jgi:hypothetical protein